MDEDSREDYFFNEGILDEEPRSAPRKYDAIRINSIDNMVIEEVNSSEEGTE